MENVMVTVIVPVYNKYDNLQKNLESIFKQTFSNIEIIITDDGSHNYSEDYIKGLIKKCSNQIHEIKEIKILHHPINVGTVKNINNAINLSDGEYIFFLSQDDCFYDEKVIETVMLNFSDSLVCTTYRECIDNLGNSIGLLPTEDRIRKLDTDNNYLDLLINRNYISGASTYYNKDVFFKYGLFDENMKLLEDYPYYLKLLKAKEKINFIPIKSIRYRTDGTSSKNNLLNSDYKKVFIREKEGKEGYLKRLLSFNIEECNYEINVKKKYKLYLKYLDILILKSIKKIFKLNIFNFFIKIGIFHE